LRNQAVHIDRKVTSNGHDIIITKKEKKNMHTDKCGNTHRQKCGQKEGENKLKYKSLCIEMKKIWLLKCKIISVIIGSNGIVTEG
jgi:hypothetical protein